MLSLPGGQDDRSSRGAPFERGNYCGCRPVDGASAPVARRGRFAQSVTEPGGCVRSSLRVELGRLCDRPHHRRHLALRPQPSSARHRVVGRARSGEGDPAEPYRRCHPRHRRRLLHPVVLRFLRAARDRRQARALPDRGAGELHELCHRPQHRCHGVLRRRGASAHLFVFPPRGDRRRENLLSHRAHLLDRQSRGARHRNGLPARGVEPHPADFAGRHSRDRDHRR